MKLISLTQGQFAMVDDADYDWLNQWKWHTVAGKHTMYAGRGLTINGKMKHIAMHRLILEITDKKILGDHIDGNGLNNQRSNLRPCTFSGNNKNKRANLKGASKYKGVHKQWKAKNWVANIWLNNKNVYLGSFKTQEAAAQAYNDAAKENYGEFARLNIIEPMPSQIHTNHQWK